MKLSAPISPAWCLFSGLELHSSVGSGDLGGEAEGRQRKPKGWKENLQLKDMHVALEMGKPRGGLVTSTRRAGS